MFVWIWRKYQTTYPKSAEFRNGPINSKLLALLRVAACQKSVPDASILCASYRNNPRDPLSGNGFHLKSSSNSSASRQYFLLSHLSTPSPPGDSSRLSSSTPEIHRHKVQIYLHSSHFRSRTSWRGIGP